MRGLPSSSEQEDMPISNITTRGNNNLFMGTDLSNYMQTINIMNRFMQITEPVSGLFLQLVRTEPERSIKRTETDDAR